MTAVTLVNSLQALDESSGEKSGWIYPYRKPTIASNDHFIVMSSQMLLHVSAYKRHHQGAHMILMMELVRRNM
jgi:hypothetical protein